MDVIDRLDAKVLANVRGEIIFDKVCFAYNEDQRDILNNLSLHIKPGQRIGVVGASSAGKATIIKSLIRYFNIKSGQIFIDSEDIADITQQSLRANISIIPQDITMFHRTILENIQLAKFDASFEEVVEACKKARVHDAILAYDTIVGERGVKVSGGQRQRIAIARAILKNAPILILDEATSALDTPIEKLIQASLNEIFATVNTTMIVIAHRLSTILHMDYIIVLEHGVIVEEGNHQQLLTLNGLYKTFWDSQTKGFIC
ncbi:MAG: ABC transporter ATP-binding protein [Janthinobacterium lividum]